MVLMGGRWEPKMPERDLGPEGREGSEEEEVA